MAIRWLLLFWGVALMVATWIVRFVVRQTVGRIRKAHPLSTGDFGPWRRRDDRFNTETDRAGIDKKNYGSIKKDHRSI